MPRTVPSPAHQRLCQWLVESGRDLAFAPTPGETSMRKHKLLIAVITFGLTWIAIVRAEDQPIEQQLVDAMNKVFGVHPGFRANHAKGIVAEGSFKAGRQRNRHGDQLTQILSSSHRARLSRFAAGTRRKSA